MRIGLSETKPKQCNGCLRGAHRESATPDRTDRPLRRLCAAREARGGADRAQAGNRSTPLAHQRRAVARHNFPENTRVFTIGSRRCIPPSRARRFAGGAAVTGITFVLVDEPADRSRLSWFTSDYGPSRHFGKMWNLVAIGRVSGHGLTCCRLAPVANDPKRTSTALGLQQSAVLFSSACQ